MNLFHPLAMKSRLVLLWSFVFLVLGQAYVFAQFTYSTSGLLHSPSGEMQKDGTVMIVSNFLNRNNLPNDSYWGYNTFSYGINITFWKRLEIAYVCTLLKGKDDGSGWPESTWGKWANQDRHFSARFLLLDEGEFWTHMPSVVIGIHDPTTGAPTKGTPGYGDYIHSDVGGSGNGFFNKMYIAATKHFSVPYGKIGLHAGYQYNRRTDYPLNAPCFAVDFVPSFFTDSFIVPRFICEYDSRTFNMGFITTLWNNHFDVMFELQALKWFSWGFRYKVVL